MQSNDGIPTSAVVDRAVEHAEKAPTISGDDGFVAIEDFPDDAPHPTVECPISHNNQSQELSLENTHNVREKSLPLGGDTHHEVDDRRGSYHGDRALHEQAQSPQLCLGSSPDDPIELPSDTEPESTEHSGMDGKVSAQEMTADAVDWNISQPGAPDRCKPSGGTSRNVRQNCDSHRLASHKRKQAACPDLPKRRAKHCKSSEQHSSPTAGRRGSITEPTEVWKQGPLCEESALRRPQKILPEIRFGCGHNQDQHSEKYSDTHLDEFIEISSQLGTYSQHLTYTATKLTRTRLPERTSETKEPI